MTAPAKLSIILAAYDSQTTLADCLERILRQAIDGMEVIVVDSGPSDLGGRIVSQRFAEVRFERSDRRLLPHAARNRGAMLAGGDLLVFTDPDVYPSEHWLERLLATYERHGGVVVGSIVCHGDRWLDRGAHLAKFDMCLPGGETRSLAITPTANLLIPRRLFENVGRFPDEYVIGDTVFSWRLASAGHSITFEPKAIVEHHHLSSWPRLLRERFDRGNEFARARCLTEGWGRNREARQLVLTVLPVRWAHLMWRTFRASLRAGQVWDFFVTSPIVMSAHAAWLTGEALALLALIRAKGRS